ncbi:hypothetical protein A2U01_0052860, partial [Trifolium medium]|nr:hypothetical protein [Trifolium medium]
CNGVGHNKRSCKGKTAADRLIAIGGNKSNTSIKHPEAQPGASVSQIQIQGSQSVSQIGAHKSGKNGAQSGANTTAQTGAQSAKNAAQTGQVADVQVQNVTTSNAKKGAKMGRKKKNEDAMGTQQ